MPVIEQNIEQDRQQERNDNNDRESRPETLGSADTKQGSSLVRLLGREIVQIVLPAIILALTIHLFLAQATIVYGFSMQPNLRPEERLVIEKISYQFHSPQRHDIVVLDLPNMPELLIKRIVGLPGETVEIRRGVLYIDGVPLEETFDHSRSGTTLPPMTLPPMTYFVLGDNRANSNDSRSFGPVKRSSIIGRAWLRYWPFRRFTRF